MGVYYVLQHIGVVVGALSGVLAASGKRIDLLGVIVLGLVTALGGGTLRDAVLGPDPERGGATVFWIRDSNYVLTAVAASVIGFFFARRRPMPPKLLAVADAAALAMFTVVGAAKTLAFGAGPINAVVLGVITGVAGGIVRDVLVGELPLVFRKETYFYATAAFAGAAVFTAAEVLLPGNSWGRATGAGLILAMRFAGIQWKLALPVFSEGEDR